MGPRKMTIQTHLFAIARNLLVGPLRNEHSNPTGTSRLFQRDLPQLQGMQSAMRKSVARSSTRQYKTGRRCHLALPAGRSGSGAGWECGPQNAAPTLSLFRRCRGRPVPRLCRRDEASPHAALWDLRPKEFSGPICAQFDRPVAARYLSNAGLFRRQHKSAAPAPQNEPNFILRAIYGQPSDSIKPPPRSKILSSAKDRGPRK